MYCCFLKSYLSLPDPVKHTIFLIFSLPVCWRMQGYCREKFYVNHFWEFISKIQLTPCFESFCTITYRWWKRFYHCMEVYRRKSVWSLSSPRSYFLCGSFLYFTRWNSCRVSSNRLEKILQLFFLSWSLKP